MQGLKFTTEGYLQLPSQFSIQLAIRALMKFSRNKENAMSGYDLSVKLATNFSGVCVGLTGKAIKRALEKLIELQDLKSQDLQELKIFMVPEFQLGKIRRCGKKYVKFYWESEV